MQKRTSRRVVRAGLFAAVATAVVVACVHDNKKERADREVASDRYRAAAPSPQLMEVLRKDVEAHGGNIEFAEKLTPQDIANLWHLSEGSDVFPLHWFIKLKSQTSAMPETRLYEKLDEKFGVIKEPDQGSYQARNHSFPLKYVGLTSSWSEAGPLEADVRVGEPLTTEDMHKLTSLVPKARANR